MTAPCTDSRFQKMLYAYELGMLGDDEREAMELHLIECEHCFARASAFADTSELLRRSPAVRRAVADGSEQTRKTGDRPKRWPAYIRVSLAAAAVLVILLLKPWQFEIRSTLEAVAAENRVTIMPFKNLTDPEDTARYGDIISELLITDLSESRYLQVVSSQRVGDIQRLLNRESGPVSDSKIGTAVARAAKARWLLTGTVIESGPDLVLTSRLIEVGSGVVEASQELTSESGESVFSLVDRLSSMIRDQLSLPDPAQSEPDRPVAEVTTHSAEAYRYYLEGVELVERRYAREARTAFEKALEYDSTFAMAYYHLARLGDSDQLDKAIEYSSAASRKEQLYIRATQADHVGDTVEQIIRLKSIIDSFPDEKEAYLRLGAHFYGWVQYDSAIHYLTRAVEIDPLYRSAYNQLTYAYSKSGDLPGAVEAINRYIALAPDEANPYDTRGDLYAENGDPERAAESYALALEVKPDFTVSAYKLAAMYILRGRYAAADSVLVRVLQSDNLHSRAAARLYRAAIPMRRGRLNETLATLDRAIADTRRDFEAVGQSGEKISFYQLKATVYAAQSNYPAALAAVDTAIAILNRVRPNDSLSYRYLKAGYLAGSGDYGSAERLYELLRADWQQSGRAPCYHLWTGALIELARDHPEAALEYLEEAARITSVSSDFFGHHMRALAYLESGRLSEAVELMEQLLKVHSTERLWRAVASVELHYYLGVAYEESRWYDRAIAQYETFLEIWKDADPDRPALAEARHRLTRLKNRP